MDTEQAFTHNEQNPHREIPEIQVAFLDLKAQFSDIQKQVLDGVQEVCESAEFVLGGAVGEFERAFSSYIFSTANTATTNTQDTPPSDDELNEALARRVRQGLVENRCVGVGNGTDALEIAIAALNFPPKSEILIPANAYFACAEAVINAGMIAVIADCERDGSFCPQDSMIHHNTKAILCVHLYGAMQDMAAYEAFVAKHKLLLIEDCAQAHGAQDELGRKAGSIGDVACFSFYPGKNLGAYGDGGAIVSKHEHIIHRAREIANHGQKATPYGYEKNHHILLGRNSRLDALQARILHIKLESLDSHNAHRARCAREYHNALERFSFLELPNVFSQSVWHLFVVRCVGCKRDELIAFLRDNGVECGVHYPYALSAIEPLRESRDAIIYDTPNATARAESIISLPIGEHLDFSHIAYIAKILERFASEILAQ